MSTIQCSQQALSPGLHVSRAALPLMGDANPGTAVPNVHFHSHFHFYESQPQHRADYICVSFPLLPPSLGRPHPGPSLTHKQRCPGPHLRPKGFSHESVFASMVPNQPHGESPPSCSPPAETEGEAAAERLNWAKGGTTDFSGYDGADIGPLYINRLVIFPAMLGCCRD